MPKSIYSQFDHSGCLVLSVSDTGTGIAVEDLATIMEPFAQARKSAHLSHEGTGLGLSLSKKLTELHGGTLSLESELGKGTTVSVWFPKTRTAIQ